MRSLGYTITHPFGQIPFPFCGYLFGHILIPPPTWSPVFFQNRIGQSASPYFIVTITCFGVSLVTGAYCGNRHCTKTFEPTPKDSSHFTRSLYSCLYFSIVSTLIFSSIPHAIEITFTFHSTYLPDPASAGKSGR